MSLTILEVINRSEQGTTRPFLCRADNGELYYVKGNYAGRGAMCREWVAGSLARLVDLPIPEFAVATVPEELVRYSARSDIGDLRVFDFNLAFDDTFEEAGFWRQHVFNDVVSSWPEPFRQEMSIRMDAALVELPRIWDQLPIEWLPEPGESPMAGGLSFETVGRWLRRHRECPDEFWAVRT